MSLLRCPKCGDGIAHTCITKPNVRPKKNVQNSTQLQDFLFLTDPVLEHVVSIEEEMFWARLSISPDAMT